MFADPLAPVTRWFREYWYDPRHVVAAGPESIQAAWQASGIDPADPGIWAAELVQLAEQVLALYGPESPYLDWGQLQAEVIREQAGLATLEQRWRTLRREVTHRLYRQIHPSRHLETLKGVGQDSAAVYASFIGEAVRFRSARQVRGWSGLVPASAQTGVSQAQGLGITQAGPALIKKYAYLDAEIGRRDDPQLAAIYYEQMMKKGKHHQQAVCACATHLLDRVGVVLREDKPYELRDVDGRAVSAEEARAIVAERYTVPADVRRGRRVQARREQAEQQAERRYQRQHRATEDRPSGGELH